MEVQILSSAPDIKFLLDSPLSARVLRNARPRGARRLMLIRLLQDAAISSVRLCRVPRSRPASASFSGSLQTRRPAGGTLKRVAGPRGFDVRGVVITERSHSAIGSVESAPNVDIKCR